MAAGLYEELFAAIVSLINRYGAAGVCGVMAPSRGLLERNLCQVLCGEAQSPQLLLLQKEWYENLCLGSTLALGTFYGVLAWGQGGIEVSGVRGFSTTAAAKEVPRLRLRPSTAKQVAPSPAPWLVPPLLVPSGEPGWEGHEGHPLWPGVPLSSGDVNLKLLTMINGVI